jgi:uncharacterized membrane protein YeaQ/YmgE (transglycosylase-associated protein family)
MPKGIIAWLLLGVIAASLERWLLPRPESGDFLGSLWLAWAGAVLGSLLASILGLGALTGAGLPNLGFAVIGIVLVLGGVRLVRREKR